MCPFNELAGTWEKRGQATPVPIFLPRIRLDSDALTGKKIGTGWPGPAFPRVGLPV